MMKKLLILLCMLIISCVAYVVFWHPSTWYRYAQAKQGNPPRELVRHAANYLLSPAATAIDFGAGVGNETKFLVEKGFTVTAIEPDVSVAQLLAKRFPSQQVIILSYKFEDKEWHTLPPVDLFVASYSLPYVEPDHFQDVWRQIVNHIKPSGYFVGHFFTPEYGGFNKKERTHMTFLTKKQIEQLFPSFMIKEMTLIDEHVVTTSGTQINANYYEVIAQKNLV